MKYVVMILVCFLWGWLMGVIFPLPIGVIFAGVGGFFIGFKWDQIWSIFEKN